MSQRDRLMNAVEMVPKQAEEPVPEKPKPPTLDERWLRLALAGRVKIELHMPVRPILVSGEAENEITVEDVIGTVVQIKPHGLPVVFWPDLVAVVELPDCFPPRVDNGMRDHCPKTHLVPVWDDDAALGILLGQARRAWKDPRAQLYPNFIGVDGWRFVLDDGDGIGPFAKTQAEALIAAIEAAPEGPPKPHGEEPIYKFIGGRP